MEENKEEALNIYKRKLLEKKQQVSNVNSCTLFFLYYIKLINYFFYNPKIVHKKLDELKKSYDKSEDDLKALQSIGQIIGEVLNQLSEEKCNINPTFNKSFFEMNNKIWNI